MLRVSDCLEYEHVVDYYTLCPKIIVTQNMFMSMYIGIWDVQIKICPTFYVVVNLEQCFVILSLYLIEVKMVGGIRLV